MSRLDCDGAAAGCLLGDILEMSTLTPHGDCLQWQPGLIWLNAVSEAVLGCASLALAVMLVIFLLRRHNDLLRVFVGQYRYKLKRQGGRLKIDACQKLIAVRIALGRLHRAGAEVANVPARAHKRCGIALPHGPLR